MKRLLPLLLSLLLCASLSACGSAKSAELSFDSVRNTKTGDTISLGMARKDVEKQLGKGAPFDREAFQKKLEALYPELNPSEEYENVARTTPPSNEFIYGKAEDYISINYENDAVVGFGTTSEDETSNWTLLGGITQGSSLEDVFQSLYEVEKWPAMYPTADGKMLYLLDYWLNADGKKAKGYVSAAFNLHITMDESTDTVLCFGVYAYDPTERIEEYKHLFENKDRVQIFDENDKDITQEYFQRLTPYYEKANWQAIEDGEMELHVSEISRPSEP